MNGNIEMNQNGQIYNLVSSENRPELCDVIIGRVFGFHERNDMLSQRRSSNSITSEILRICSKGATKTKIVYQANLNFLTVQPYLDNLTKKGFIEAVPQGSRVIYRTTPKGLELKERFEQFHREMDKLYANV